jgi:hypothetical protein
MGIIKSRASQAQGSVSSYYPSAPVESGGLKRKAPPGVDNTGYYTNPSSSSGSYNKQPYNPSVVRSEYGGKSGDRYSQYDGVDRGVDVMYQKGGSRHGGRLGGPSGGPPGGRMGGRPYGQVGFLIIIVYLFIYLVMQLYATLMLT